jgi:hypothetical protein
LPDAETPARVRQALLRETGNYRKESCDHKTIRVNGNVTKLLTEVAARERAPDLER